jgi:hypothetical protein
MEIPSGGKCANKDQFVRLIEAEIKRLKWEHQQNYFTLEFSVESIFVGILTYYYLIPSAHQLLFASFRLFRMNPFNIDSAIGLLRSIPPSLSHSSNVFYNIPAPIAEYQGDKEE